MAGEAPDAAAAEAKPAPSATRPAEPEQKPEAESAPPAAPDDDEPKFPEDASVNEAIKAVPQSAERLNVDPEILGKPLQDIKLYEPCKPGGAHFKLRVAVWRGKAVGIDLITRPPNPRLAKCIKGHVRELSWPVKVPSLNTIEFDY